MQTASIETAKIKKAANRDKNHWREIITAWQKSNEHPKVFCARMDIKLGTFLHWRGVFKKELKPQENKFIELAITPQAQNVMEPLIIECPSGHKIICASALEQAQVIFTLLGVSR